MDGEMGRYGENDGRFPQCNESDAETPNLTSILRATRQPVFFNAKEEKIWENMGPEL
jgi:hypothetical protein